MPDYTIYPAVDATYNFPPQVRQAVADSQELKTNLTNYLPYKALARNPDLLISGSISRDANGVISSAPVVWPNGSVGTYTTLAIDTSGAINSYSITYGSPVTATYTQPTITRDANGAATNVPQIAVS